MKVIICGAGQVGWQIARHLSSEKNDVTVVDNNAELVARATDTLDVSGIAGNASYPDVLTRAGARDADMIIAATFSDEVNMVTCQVAHSVFKIPRKIARLRSQSYLDAIYSDLYQRDHLPIDVVISPEREVAEQALRQLASPSTFDTEPFMNGDAELIGLALEESCAVLNTPLKQLSELFSTLRATVVGIRRKGVLMVPNSSDELYAGDQIYLCTHTDDMARCLEIFGKTSSKQERVLIIGGGNVGLSVAHRLEQSTAKIHVKMIEANRACAERAADELERTIVLHGDGLDMELLEEANIANTDAVLAVTDDDKTNLLAAARAKSMGCPMAVSLVNDPTLSNLMKPLNIDAFINPRATTVSSILRHIRHGRVRAVYSIGDAEAEVIEAQILSSSPIAGREIRDIEWPEGAIIGAIKKGDKVLRPVGGTKVEEGDIVVIFTLASDVPEVERLFQVNIDFF
ncbi:Trk system potassium transport protein TrkA [Amylibacter kogurei]|uniref:Trk system potassium uptake protein TrkA n=1 Tax=Paramylibacter kogurei TaxID=1889778 RepID=A0A2G5K6N5_9RHOB|nr:Trk system potassium transporter TrkA [Amylibacter kogurei]PIB24769.1 Trk system potassium transport protein TrkA [Amylibacter kogurei]